jgi:hypothetical protein
VFKFSYMNQKNDEGNKIPLFLISIVGNHVVLVERTTKLGWSLWKIMRMKGWPLTHYNSWTLVKTLIFRQRWWTWGSRRMVRRVAKLRSAHSI